MNRREFTLAFGAVVAAGSVPSSMKLPDFFSGGGVGWSVTFDYEDGTKVGPLPATVFRNVLTSSFSAERTGAVVGVSLYMDGERIVSADLKQTVFCGSTANLVWPIRLV